MTPIEIILAILGSNVATSLITSFLNRRQSNADANHTVVESAGDVLTMAKASYEWRIGMLESQALKLQGDIENLNKNYAKDIGDLSKKLSGAFQTIKVLSARIKVLSIALRKSGSDVPEWPDEPDAENI